MDKTGNLSFDGQTACPYLAQLNKKSLLRAWGEDNVLEDRKGGKACRWRGEH